MAWVRIDEKFAEHPKVARAGPLGMAMHVAALCYCNRQLTDGFVPKQIAKGLLDLEGIGMRMWDGDMVGGGEDASWNLIVDDLVQAGLWEPVEGGSGWKIHDYHDYQPSKAHIQEVKNKRQQAGSKGGQGKTKPKQTPKQNASSLVGGCSVQQEANGGAKSKPDTDTDTSYSDPIGSGADAPPIDPVKALFDQCIGLLTGAGVSERQARSACGKWRKDYGDLATARAVRAAAIEAATEPIAYIEATLKRSGKPRPSGQETEHDDKLAILRALGIEPGGGECMAGQTEPIRTGAPVAIQSGNGGARP